MIATNLRHGLSTATLLSLALAAGLPPGVTVARGQAEGSAAHVARMLRATDRARLHYVHSSGSFLYEIGTASGTLPGKMRADVNVGATITGTFTIYIRGGAIKGHGSAVPHGSGVSESFSGSLVVTGGTGRYAHAHGRAQLYGTFNRENYSLVVQTAGTLLY